jgi:hypothetical protein
MIPLTRALAERRHALVALSREQRAGLTAMLQPTARGLGMLDRVLAAVRARPFVISLAAAALVVLGPRRLLPWVVRVAPFAMSFATLLRRL